MDEDERYAYILKDLSGRFYIGSTINLERRVKARNKGYTQTTRNMDKPEVVLVQEYETLELARKVERRIKKLKRKECVEKMVKDGFITMKI